MTLSYGWCEEHQTMTPHYGDRPKEGKATTLKDTDYCRWWWLNMATELSLATRRTTTCDNYTERVESAPICAVGGCDCMICLEEYTDLCIAHLIGT